MIIMFQFCCFLPIKNMAILRPDVGPLQTRSDPLGSVPDLNGLQMGLPPDLSKPTPPDPIQTPTDSALVFQVQSDPLRVRSGVIKFVPERWTSPLDFKMKVGAERFSTLIRFSTDFFCSQRTLIFLLSPIVCVGSDQTRSDPKRSIKVRLKVMLFTF